jgi:hypothetical protein
MHIAKNNLYDLFQLESVCVDLDYPCDASAECFDPESPTESHPSVIINARRLSLKPRLNQASLLTLKILTKIYTSRIHIKKIQAL